MSTYIGMARQALPRRQALICPHLTLWMHALEMSQTSTLTNVAFDSTFCSVSHARDCRDERTSATIMILFMLHVAFVKEVGLLTTTIYSLSDTEAGISISGRKKPQASSKFPKGNPGAKDRLEWTADESDC